jgi:hypothetical protein
MSMSTEVLSRYIWRVHNPGFPEKGWSGYKPMYTITLNLRENLKAKAKGK